MRLRTPPLMLAAAVGPFLGGSADPPPAATSLKDAESAIAQVVSIRTWPGGARRGHGSAFYVTGRGHLLTCFHVLDRMPREDMPRLLTSDGAERAFEVVRVDREADLALLLSDPPQRFLALADTSLPDVGERALFGGVPGHAPEAAGGPPVAFQRCAVAAVGPRRAGSGRAIVNIKVDRLADAGLSGGPLLAEETLAVIGVMRANLESATGGVAGMKPKGYGLAVPLMYVRPLLGEDAAMVFPEVGFPPPLTPATPER